MLDGFSFKSLSLFFASFFRLFRWLVEFTIIADYFSLIYSSCEFFLLFLEGTRSLGLAFAVDNSQVSSGEIMWSFMNFTGLNGNLYFKVLSHLVHKSAKAYS